MQQFSTISELKSKVEALLATQEGLCIHGFGVVGEGIMAIADRDRQFEIERAALLSPDCRSGNLLSKEYKVRTIETIQHKGEGCRRSRSGKQGAPRRLPDRLATANGAQASAAWRKRNPEYERERYRRNSRVTK